ncbi:MAG: universal stress protein, partial [Mycobacterium leprae]
LDDVRHLTVEVDPRIALDSCTHADVMVVGARGRGMLKAFGVGSTTDWLLHRPLTPLVVVRSARPIHRALVCVDGSVHADAAVRAFATMPWLPQVDIVVLGVDDGRAEPASACETAEALLGTRAGQVTTVLTAGGATSAILDAVAREDSDLVVLGTRGLTGLRRLRVGSTASAVARDADRTTLLAMARTESDDDE